MSGRRFIPVRPLIRLGIVLVIGWWLFRDTHARHFPASTDSEIIRFAHFGGAEDFALWRSIVDSFEQTHPGAHVKQEYIVGFAGRYNTKLRQQIVSHTLPDVALVQLGPFHELADNFADVGRIVTPNVRESLDAVGLVAFQHGGKQLGLPISGGNLLIYCNPECFEKAGNHIGREVSLPADDWTISDFHRIATELTCDFDGDGAIDQFGYWQTRWVYYLPFLWSFGADITDETSSRWMLMGPEAQQAMSFYRELVTGDRVCPREDEVPQLFQDVGFLTGKVGMCINGPWFQPFLAKTRLADSYVVAHIPIGPAGRVTRITWDAVVMRDDLPPLRRRAALAFIEFLISAPVQDRIAQTGRALPARTESVTRFIGDANDPRRRRFVEALSYSRTQPMLPAFGVIDRTINRHLQDLLDPDRPCDVQSFLIELASDPVIGEHFTDQTRGADQ